MHRSSFLNLVWRTFSLRTESPRKQFPLMIGKRDTPFYNQIFPNIIVTVGSYKLVRKRTKSDLKKEVLTFRYFSYILNSSFSYARLSNYGDLCERLIVRTCYSCIQHTFTWPSFLRIHGPTPEGTHLHVSTSGVAEVYQCGSKDNELPFRAVTLLETCPSSRNLSQTSLWSMIRF